jgi:hypothetical protein
MKIKILDLAVACVLAGIAPATAAQQSVMSTSPSTDGSTGAVDCNSSGCSAGDGVLFELRTRGERQPLTVSTTEVSDSAELQPDRRVTVEAQDTGKAAPGKAVAIGKWSVQLPNGGLLWAIEDPALAEPVLNLQAPSQVSFKDGRIVEPVRFYAYTNYESFIERMEVSVYDGNDTDLVAPLAKFDAPAGNGDDVEWDGTLADTGSKLRVGDELLYVLRVYDAKGNVDETAPGRLQLIRPEDRERSLERQRIDAASQHRGLSADDLESRKLIDQTYGESTLRRQTIPLRGSRVRLYGQMLPEDARLTVNGETVPIDMERKFASEYLLPTGSHEFDIQVQTGGQNIERKLTMDVSGRYSFLVALADVTASENASSGSIEALSADDRYDQFLVDGRLAFYLKGKVKGKYLITAQADTAEHEIDDLFTGFLDADPQDIFRRLDPDLYYPVYGDDSVAYRDVDTQGQLYVRVDWDKSQALWGNFQTSIATSEYNQYNRSLYGAGLNYNSRAANFLGESKTHLKLFASEAQTAVGHSEFLGTGGSLYYLRHTDLLPGSDIVNLEIRDATTGRVESTVQLVRGVDYEIDEMQGRIILTRPLSQVTRENLPTITRDAPLDGYDNVLLVDYEYVPVGFDDDQIAAGFRGKQWFGDHVAFGATYIDENRSGDDYSLKSADLTLQAGRGTYVKLEHVTTESTAAPIFYSDNGGLSFLRRNPDSDLVRKGDADSVEARINFMELGWTQRDWTAGAWWRDIDAGYSISRYDSGLPVLEYGAEFAGDLNDQWRLSGRYSQAERGDDAIEQAQLLANWRPGEYSEWTAELRRVTEERDGVAATGTLAAVRYDQRIGSSFDLYGIAQVTVDDDDGAYEENDSYSLGGKYLFTNLSTVGAEASTGDRGDAFQLNGEYRLSPDHTFYGAYTHSTDRTTYDPLFVNRDPGGLTLGQRWRMSNRTNLYNESQWLRSGEGAKEENGIAHTFGMDFYPGSNVNLGFTLQDGKLDANSGTVDRQAVSINGGWSSADTSWDSKLEYRRDRGAEQRDQWVSTNRLMHKLNESWRIAARLNYADTQDLLDEAASAKFIEGNVGFAWRPWDSNKIGLLGKYTYLYDRGSAGQEDDSNYDQRSHVFAIEGTYRPNAQWEFAGKLAHRIGEARLGRGQGEWLDSSTDFAAVQGRFYLSDSWSALAEHRWLRVEDGGTRKGWLVGVDRDISDNFRVGVGYNLTDFSDDLTELEYDYKGWFLNIVGYY